MKKLTLLLLLSLLGVSESAISQNTNENQTTQDSTNKEIGITFSNLNRFGLIYKKERKENRYTRFEVGNVIFSTFSDSTIGRTYGSLNFSIGLERRIKTGENLTFLHGFRPGLSSSYLETQMDTTTNNSLSFTPYLSYIIGFQVSLSNHFNLVAEISPNISSHFAFDDGQYQKQFNLGFSLSNSARISLIYNFKN